jgi:putative hydrolase of the HAD superfamily
MLKAVIFDLDNTLIDFMSMKKAASAAAANAMIEAVTAGRSVNDHIP